MPTSIPRPTTLQIFVFALLTHDPGKRLHPSVIISGATTSFSLFSQSRRCHSIWRNAHQYAHQYAHLGPLNGISIFSQRCRTLRRIRNEALKASRRPSLKGLRGKASRPASLPIMDCHQPDQANRFPPWCLFMEAGDRHSSLG